MTTPYWLWLLFPAATMSLGWGLRGYIGGGPLGAMIPGSLVALAVCLLLGRRRDAAAIAAFGAVGIGFGGQMTYGQTIGLAFQPETQSWGLLGLGLKGGIWGWLGGGVLGLSLIRQRLPLRDIVIAFAAMTAATWTGWKLVNEPKLIYFSNRLDRPRPEIWFGLFLAGAVLLAFLAWRKQAGTPLRFALWGALAGAIGFAFGGYIQVVGRAYDSHPLIGYWKIMELTLGWCLGMAYGHAAWGSRADAGDDGVAPAAPASNALASLTAGGAVIVAAWWLTMNLPLRFDYSVVGVVLLTLALVSKDLAWHIAISMTFLAFAIDWARYEPPIAIPARWAIVAVSSLAVGWLVQRWREAWPLFLLMLWTSTGVSVAKSTIPKMFTPVQVNTELAFLALAIAATVMGRRVLRYTDNRLS